MFRNYLKVALRNLWKSKTYAFINILGLAVGMAICMLVFLFVQHEESFDQWHDRADQVYRLNEVQQFGENSSQKVALSMPLMGETLQEEFPEIVNFTRFYDQGRELHRAGEQELFIDKTVAVDSTFFQIFNYNLKEGDPKRALVEPFSMVVTEKVARNFFGDANPIGKVLSDEGQNALKITGVMEDVPDNSHLQFDALVSISSMTSDTSNQWMRRWGSNFLTTYLVLQPETNVEALEKKFPDYLVRQMDEEVLDYLELFLQPLGEVHLGSADITHDYHNFQKYDKSYVSLFVMLGLFVLIIASINFMNLSTARSMHRAKEVGVRKTIGAKRWQLIGQFLAESTILAVISMVIAIFLAEALVGTLNDISSRELSLGLWRRPLWLLSILGIGVAVGLFSGVYPALVLSGFKPLAAIRKQKERSGSDRINLRSGLVVLQFAIAIGLIISTLVVTQQHEYMRNLDPGFDKEQTLVIGMNREINDKYPLIKEQFLNVAQVQDVTTSGQRLGNNLHQTSLSYESEQGIEGSSSSFLNVDYNYVSFYDLELLKGRGFSEEQGTDMGRAYIINETLSKELGWGDDPIGKKMKVGGPEGDMGQVVGLVKDFNYNSLHHKIEPLFLCLQDWRHSEISVRVDGGQIPTAIAGLEEKWRAIMGDRPFEYSFLDEHFATLYQSEMQVSQVVMILASLAIFIACLGLFGLATIITEQRTKEIGVRKILGASMGQLLILLSKDFTRLVFIAFLVTVPMAWWLLGDWLSDFAYRIDMQWWVFAIAGVAALLIAWLTVSFKSLYAARANPVEALRYE